MRDLEIRGAGNVLGTSQHGHMEAVGYEMYLKLLSEAVSEQRGESTVPQQECLVDIRIGAHIPEGYIDNLSQRIDIYKKIASIQNEADAMDVTDELIDRFGDPPQAVQGLIEVALLRNIAASLGIYEISQKNDMIVFTRQYLTSSGPAGCRQRCAAGCLLAPGPSPISRCGWRRRKNRSIPCGQRCI